MSERSSTYTIFLLCIILGVIARISAALGDLWLDEIWSLQIAQTLGSPLQALTEVRSDNSHILNTIWLWFIGAPAAAWLYRLPAVLFGLASIKLFHLVAKRIAAHAAELSTALFSLSYVVILYGSEARGYSGALFFALLGFLLASEYSEKQSLKLTLLYLACCVLGLLSHLSFVIFLVALLFWHALLVFRGECSLKSLLLLHLPALGVVVIAYLFYVRELEAVHGPLRGYLDVTLETAALLLGALPFSVSNINSTILSMLLALVALALVARGSFVLKGSNQSYAALILIVIVVSPLLVLLATQPRTIFVRYFFIPFVFALIPVGVCLKGWIDQKGASRLIARSLLILYLLLNLRLIYYLEAYGRNSFASAAKVISQDTAVRPIRIATSQEFRLEKIVSYLPAQDGNANMFELVHADQTFDYYILQNQDINFEPSFTLKLASGAESSLMRTFYAAPLSGINLLIYKKIKQP